MKSKMMNVIYTLHVWCRSLTDVSFPILGYAPMVGDSQIPFIMLEIKHAFFDLV